MTEALLKNMKLSAGIIGAVAATLGSIWAIDSHYASASDITQFRNDVNGQIQEVKIDTTLKTYALRREMLRDKVEDLNLKEDSQKLTPYETRQRERYVAEIRELDSYLTDAQRKQLGLPSKVEVSESEKKSMARPDPNTQAPQPKIQQLQILK